MGTWVEEGNTYTDNVEGYTAYTFDSNTGLFSNVGNILRQSSNSTLFVANGNTILRYQGVYGYDLVYRNTAVSTYRQGTYISNILAIDSTYPNNGRNADGYWYVKVSAIPQINIFSPSQNSTFCENDHTFLPQISVSDADNDSLTCKYYLDSETAARDTKTATSTTTSQVVSFNTLDMNTLAEGSHTIKYEVSDGKASPVTSSAIFIVDKSAPAIGTVSLTSATNSITVSGSAIDTVSRLDDFPYRYTYGTYSTSWSAIATNTKSGLTPNTLYPVIFEAKDIKNHIAGNTQNIYTKAEVPSLAVTSPTSYTLDASLTGSAINNPDATQYLISVTQNGTTQYVTQEGNLTSSQVWPTLTNKRITIRGLTPSTTYSIQAKAKNGGGIETAQSSAVSGTTLIPPPVAPINLIATATSNQIAVAWDPVQGAAGYEIQADSTIVDVGTSTVYTNTSLSPGTPHTYQVRAKNEGGAGAWSTQITKSTLPSSPNIPVNLNAVPQSTSITVTWNNVAGATGYDVEVDGVLVSNGPNTNYVHSSLIPGTHHTYRVRSINPGGKSEWSAPVSTTATQVSSPVPVNLAAAPSQNEIDLTWDAVNGATGYDIEVDGIAIDNNTRTSYAHKNLAPGSQHMYRVRSGKNGVISDWSSAVVSTTLTDVFGTPVNVKASANCTDITLTWNPVAGATTYEVEADGAVLDNETSPSAIISGLQPNSSHTYRVRASNGTTTSDWCQPLQMTTFALETPVFLNSASTETTVNVVWNATSGSSITYDLEVDGTVVPAIQGNTYTCIGLPPNSQHVFRVRAVNASGASNWSIPLTKSTMFSGVTAPTGLFAVMKSTSATVSWQHMNGAAAYDLEADGVLMQNITNTKYIHAGLQAGSQHTYRVRAKNETGASDWSNVITVMTISNGPSVPTHLAASSTTSKILASWDQVAGAGEYEIQVDGVVVANGSGTSYLQSNLSPNTEHTYRVRAKSPAGYSTWSDPVTIKTKSSTMTYAVDCENGEEFSLVFSADNIQDLDRYTFTITYDPGKLDVADLCSATSRLDTAVGNITGTDLEIIQSEAGTIVFRKAGNAQSYEVWSGIVNSIKFKSKFAGQTNVTYSFQ